MLCSEHFAPSAYQVPPGLKKRKVRLKDDAVPSIFPSYPPLLQPAPAKKRRVLVRSNPTEPSPATATEPTEDAQDTQDTQDIQDDTVVDAGGEGQSRPTMLARRRVGRPKVNPEVRIPQLKRRIKTLSQRLQRVQKKAKVQKNVLHLLQRDNKIQHAKLDSIDGCLAELVANEAENRGRKTKKSFSQPVKEFVLTMYYYSPRAYAYLKTVFTLPTPRTIRRWLESVNCEPGFLTDMIKSVSEKCPENRNIFSLVIDSMSIRKKLSMDRASGQIIGYVTIGDSEKLASEALVFLLVPLLGGVRHPIGYFYVDKIDSEMQAQLIKQCLKLTAENKINIINITCDGCAANITTFRKLGADIPTVCHFQHPTLDHPVYTTLDPVHMLKLARNALGTIRRFQAPDGIVDYKYIEDLVAIQDEMGLHLANKITRKHLNWRSMKMKVRLAAQMLSSSVADALAYLSETDTRFKDAKATINFIRQVNTASHY